MPGMLTSVPHRFDYPRLLRVEHFLPTTHPASRPRRGEPGHRALTNQFFLKLRQRGEKVEDQPTCGCTDAESFLKRDEVDTALIEPVHNLKKISD